ncbi:hypothetical protein [Rhodopirellula halodulae]|uniref:hypothetical protein n=1 Tax=Rhodopirellula halodulae TaxID=2894198 RepID=UPI001E37BA45|nr:hypothetical protein [Rhodopirellula sp. JC737]MCC9655740.1 hypothetical protein [Rhodopirellula sp. JC737]
MSAYFVVYEHFIYAIPTNTMRFFSIWDLQSLPAYQKFRGLLTDATIAWILFAAFGYRLEKQGATDNLGQSSSKNDDVTNKAVGS